MKIIHRVCLDDSPNQRDLLHSLGISFHTPESPLITFLWFDVDESHPSWPKLQPLLEGCDANNIVRTEFDSQERDSAAYLQLCPSWHHGYPQPDDDFGYHEATYDLKRYCAKCDVGPTQVAPFRMKGEPRWGRRGILQLNWVFDEFFVVPAIWESIFRPLGIGCRPVLNHRTGNELKTVVQLKIDHYARSTLSLTAQYASEICESCGQKKWHPISRGFFPAFASDPSYPICRTQEYFGSGASAWNGIVVSNAIYRTLQDHKIRGVTFAPMQNS
jgi:hypothetical protein